MTRFPKRRRAARIGGQQLRGKIGLHTSGACDAAAMDLCAPMERSPFHAPLQTLTVSASHRSKEKSLQSKRVPASALLAPSRAPSCIPVNITPKENLSTTQRCFCRRPGAALEEGGRTNAQNLRLSNAKRSTPMLSLSRQVLDHYEKLGPKA